MGVNPYRENVVGWLDCDDGFVVKQLAAKLNISVGEVVHLAIVEFAKNTEEVTDAEKQS